MSTPEFRCEAGHVSWSPKVLTKCPHIVAGKPCPHEPIQVAGPGLRTNQKDT